LSGRLADVFAKFPFTLSLGALDRNHMAVQAKDGPAVFSDSRIVATSDGGSTWTTTEIPHTNLSTFLARRGLYWTVGNEVVEREKRGGHAVARAFFSRDGVSWKPLLSDISGCQFHGCHACTAQGCLSSDSNLARIFGGKTSYAAFAPNKELTTKWASTDSTLCFVGRQLQCSPLHSVDKSQGEGGPPTPVASRPLGAPAGNPPYCISCGVDPIFVDPKVQGSFNVKLTVEIAGDGTVRGVEVSDAPSSLIADKIRLRASEWLFEPYLKDRNPVAVKLNTRVRINVIRNN